MERFIRIITKKLIKNFMEEISNKYNLDIEYTEIFINSNLNKIKYDKYKKNSRFTWND